MVDLYTASIIIFFVLLGILIYADRKKIEFKYILILRRTKKFGNLIDRIARISPLGWKVVGTIGIIVALYYMVQGLYLLLLITYQISAGVITEPALQFILPTPAATGSSGPGYILIPFWFWIITIGVILVPHEMFHGVIARAEKIKLKSVGLLLLAIFPGAFVEPDDKQLKKASLMTKLRIFSAGSFANILISFAVFLLAAYVLWPIAAQPGVQILSVNETSPAASAGLESGMTLSEINGNQVTTTYQEYLSGRGYFLEELGDAKPGDFISVRLNEKLYNIRLGMNNETNSTYLGITYSPILSIDSAFFLTVLMPLLTMISLFSLAVGIVNILPLYPLDGGLIAQALAEKVFKRRSKEVVRGLSYFILLIFIYSFLGPLL